MKGNKRKMERISFSNIEDLVIHFTDLYECLCEENKYTDICIVASAEQTEFILSELISYGYPLAYLKYTKTFYNEYRGEYYISLNHDGIWCEQAYDEESGLYLTNGSDVVYLLDDCNSKIIKKLDTAHVIEVNIDFCEDENEEEVSHDCANCDYKYDCDESDYYTDECDEDCDCDEDDVKEALLDALLEWILF